MIIHKRGDTFAYAGLLPAEINFSGAAITSQIRNEAGKLVANVDVAVQGKGIQLRVNETNNWPIGKVFLDIQFKFKAGDVVSTSTVTIKVIPDITRETAV